MNAVNTDGMLEAIVRAKGDNEAVAEALKTVLDACDKNKRVAKYTARIEGRDMNAAEAEAYSQALSMEVLCKGQARYSTR